MLKSSLSFKAINKVLFTVKIPPVALMPSLSHTHIAIDILLQRSHLAYKQTGAAMKLT